MANEYFHRTPTSTGNRSVYTISVWIKKQGIEKSLLDLSFLGSGDGTTYAIAGTGAFGSTYNNRAFVRNGGSNTGYFDRLFRDLGAWTNFLWSVDTTQSGGGNRIKLYVNGADVGELSADIALNTLTNINTTNIHSIGTFNLTAGPGYTSGYDTSANYSDYFFVDGQALTPDVFGFYKEGKGYESSGTTQATDFRPGQWSPHSPRKIKTEIERRGGFGVNGFYLPMNDSSNFGADFHCAPNSIIKLKGEDLPQPRNGAPTTTDAYVSQLRSDPYAANLVLAVPGISTATGSNLVTNGTFDSDVSGWGVSGGTFTWNNGRAQHVTTSNVSVYQQITGLTIGQRYTFQYIHYSGYTSAYISTNTVSSGSILHLGDTTTSSATTKRGSFTATATSHYVVIYGIGSNTSIWDDVIVKQEDAPRDYSADIKGSGSNKTLTPTGNSGVGYELGGYYGSAINFPYAAGQRISTTSSDFAMGTGDFTVEVWIYPNQVVSYKTVFATRPTQAGYTDGFNLWIDTNGATGVYSNAFLTQSADGAIVPKQWTHLVAERYNGTLTTYVNGVAADVQTSNTQNYTRTVASIGELAVSDQEQFDGAMQDLRVYKGVAKYKGGFDVSKPYTPVGFEGESWRQISDTYKSNFATMNPLASTATHTNGNLTVSPDNSVNYSASISNLMVNSGKWYCELRFDEESTGLIIPGISELENLGFRDIYGGTNYFGQSIETNDTAGIRFEPTAANDGDIISLYMDLDSSPITCSFTVNGGSATTYNSGDLTYNYNNLIPGRTYGFVAADAQSAVTGIQATFNFGQNPTFSGQTGAGTYTDANGKGLFKYQPPAGYLALCEDNLPTPAIADPGEHFKSVLWTGVDATNKIKCGFQPDFVWVKNRDYVNWHSLYDSIRGPYLELVSNDTSADRDRSTNDGLRSFDPDGFTSGLDDNTGGRAGDSYVAWCWKAGGPAVSNTDGSITSQVSVNQTAGFSIVSFTSTSSGNFTIGHGLGKTPKLIITKERGASNNWHVWHSDVMTTSSQFLMLNSTAALGSYSTVWGTSIPTSLVFGATVGSLVNASTASIAYCWAEIEGFSKFGSYTGNGLSDGPFIWCGFKPAWLMVKRTDSTSDWGMYDSSRNSTNPWNKYLIANEPDVEGTATFGDFLSNGFKWRYTGAMNQNGATYIFAAFAESPFQTANAK